MTFFGMALLTAAATVVLAAFAIVTAWYARRAFLKQSQEVTAIERQVADGQEVASQQAKLLEIQAGQLEVLRGQLEAQREATTAQGEVLSLQASDLRESLEERKREAERRHRAQAASVFISQQVMLPGSYYQSTSFNGPAAKVQVRNASGQPIYDAELVWRRGSASWGDPNPEPLGTLMPGADETQVREYPPDTNMDVSGAILRFTDAAGVKWIHGQMDTSESSSHDHPGEVGRKVRTNEQRTSRDTLAAHQRGVSAVRGLRDLTDDELIAQTRGQSSTAPAPHHEMEMQRRLKDSIEGLTKETAKARWWAFWGTVAVIALTLVLVALTIALALKA